MEVLPLLLGVFILSMATVSWGHKYRRRNDTKTFHIGITSSWTGSFPRGKDVACGFIVALETIQERQLLPGYDFKYALRDANCNPRVAIVKALELWSTLNGLDVIIGDICSVACQPIALLAAAWNIPAISYYCASDALSNTKTYPTFTRTLSGFRKTIPVVMEVMRTFNWSRIAVVTETADLHRLFAEYGISYFESNGQEVIYKSFASTLVVKDGKEILNRENVEKLRNIIRELKHQVRIFIVLMYTTDLRNFLIIAHEEGMLNGEYAFHGMDAFPNFQEDPPWRPDLSDAFLYQGFMGVEMSLELSSGFEKFRDQCWDAYSLPVFDRFPKPSSPRGITAFAGMMHDALLMWALAVNKTLQQGYSASDGLQITDNIYNLTFEGMTGLVVMDQSGDRDTNFEVKMMRDGERVTILEWRALQGLLKRHKPENPDDWSGLLWSGNGTTVPLGYPECGWKGELCAPQEDNSQEVKIISIGATAAALMLFIMAAGIAIRKSMYENSLKDIKKYILQWSQLDTATAGMVASHTTLESLGSESINVLVNTVKIGGYVAMKKALGSSRVDVTNRQVLVELKTMADMKHVNINEFLGVCLEVPNSCVLMRFTAHGSLHDILTSEEVKLPWDFKLSLANDIANGMKYLHSSTIGYHGHITSHNCVIDNRWICKITDYGLRTLMKLSQSAQDQKNAMTSAKSKYALWTAPELLQDAPHVAIGSKEGDVYSFGIIIQELVLEGPPYCENVPQLAEEEIVRRVRAKEFPPYRPVVVLEGHTDWATLMANCWSENPTDRPNFRQVLTTFTTMNGGVELNLIDKMVKRLEHHAQNLEDIVYERTLALNEEKQKIEILLSELLPPSVAKSLSAGSLIPPETFDSVTISFSDIVSFTRISAAGTPIDVVKMLNLMYTLFDHVSAKYDVYKVATIGDAYFVASGVPSRNGEKHAVEICSMALDLIQSVNDFSIPHLPNETLKLRIGIHSGSCVAGVAGVKMPRYMLFGDTVDIASHMEAGGESMRIHVSPTTSELLSHHGGFTLRERGRTDIKGLGTTVTYWLAT